MSRCARIACWVLLACAAQAQPFQFSPNFFPVVVHDSTLSAFAFAGGINGPKIQFVDIDHDGDLDLFVLDVAGSLSFFENTGTRTDARWSLRTTDFGGLHLSRWFRFEPIEDTGRYDLFAGGANSTVDFYRNDGTRQQAHFVLAASPLRDSASAPVQSEEQCLPTFVDIDGDGDLDFMSGNSIGTIVFYENTGTPTSPQFTFRSGQWQGIKIISPAGPPDDGEPHIMHGANALAFCDIDHNGSQDLFFGDLFTKGLLFFRNDSPDSGRTTRIHVDSMSYPYSRDSVRTTGFNAPFLCDIDGDGADDLFVGHLLGARNSLWYYHNSGTATQPRHQLATREFLPMIDAGTDARIALGDVNGDGLADMIVCSQQGLVQYFENTGTMHAPRWEHRTDSLVPVFASQNLAPALVDLDNDGTLDLVLGTAAGTLQWYQNVSANGHAQLISGGNAQLFHAVHVGQNATPVFHDLDGDGDQDLLVGQAGGRLSFYRNTGSATSPQFEIVTDFFDSLVVGGTQPVNSTPAFGSVDGTASDDLLVGRGDGTVRVFRNAGTTGAPRYVMAIDTFAGVVVQGNAAPVMVDIDGDGDLDLFVGTRLGGVQAFENMKIDNGVAAFSPLLQPALDVWPNPCGDLLHTVDLPAGAREVLIYDVLGRCVAHAVPARNQDRCAIPLRGIPSGTYVAQVRTGKGMRMATFFHWE